MNSLTFYIESLRILRCEQMLLAFDIPTDRHMSPNIHVELNRQPNVPAFIADRLCEFLMADLRRFL